MGPSGWVIAPTDPDAADFAAALAVHPLTAALLRRRGIATTAAAQRFLDPRLEDLADPESLPGMPAAAERVARAIVAGERIAVHGDYDVDGITATAILLRSCRGAGGEPLWHLPHRLVDGYGLGCRAVDALAAQGVRLLVAVDCGITAHEAVARARGLGMDVVIVDHHASGPERPPAIIVEGHHEDAPPHDSPATPLCAAGLAFMLALAVRRRLGLVPVIPEGLPSLAALGTVADVVPLIEDNRRLVAAGIAEINAAGPVSLRALADVAGITGPVRAWHLSWQLGPRLNAPGRLGDPAPALRLLLTDDPAEAAVLARDLDNANRERQAMLDRTLAEALAQAEEGGGGATALVVAGPEWHPGVVGLVAGRLAERYRCPAVAIGLGDTSGRGSARSVPGFNLVEALRACQSHLLGFGGHAMAAGMTIAREAIPGFRQAFSALAGAGAAERAAALRMEVDAEVRLADLSAALIGELERLGPFGAGNPEPVLAVSGARTLRRRVIGDGRHLRLDVTDGTETVEAIGFAMAAAAELLLFTEAPVDLAFVPERDPASLDHVRLRVVALNVPGVDPARMLADTGALLGRLFSRAADYLHETRNSVVEDALAFYSKVAGVTFDGRQSIIATVRPGDRLRLVREPANPHDPHAVRVTTADGRDLGYLRAQLAGRLSPSIDAGAVYRATVAAVTGGGGHSWGVSILVERDDDPRAAADAAPPRGTAGGARSAEQRAAQTTAQLRARYMLSPRHEEAVAAIAAGAATITVPPGRGAASLLACGAIAVADDRRCALVVTPLRRQAVHRADQIRARLGPLGFRVHAVHGQQDVRERERVDAALRAEEADVVVATWETLAGGWATRHADRIAAVLCDGAPGPELSSRLGAIGVGVSVLNATSSSAVTPAPGAPHQGGPPGGNPQLGAGRLAHGVVDDAVRTGLRLVDRRNADVCAAVEELCGRDEKCVIYAFEREACVQLAARLRERPGQDGRVAYLHRGLPARVREIIVQAFRENRIGILVTTSALDEEALPDDVRQIVLASLPPDRAQLAAAAGALGFDERLVTVTALFRADEIPRRRRSLDARAPDRPLLASLYRALMRWRGGQPVAWPDDATWRYLSEELPGLAPAAVDAASAILEEAGLVARETAGPGGEIQFLSTTYRDLAQSVRYREGRRERAAFEDCARWAVQAGPWQLLQVLAARDEPAPLPPPAPGARG